MFEHNSLMTIAFSSTEKVVIELRYFVPHCLVITFTNERFIRIKRRLSKVQKKEYNEYSHQMTCRYTIGRRNSTCVNAVCATFFIGENDRYDKIIRVS